MKNTLKKRTFISAIAMLVVSAIVLTSSTFAWFSMAKRVEVETMQLIVIKKDGSKELFDRNKLLSGLLKACQKRPVNAEEIVAEVETELQNSLSTEITTVEIGEMAMRILKARDEVAYVRFASVYREFKDIETFMSELKNLKKQLK